MRICLVSDSDCNVVNHTALVCGWVGSMALYELAVLIPLVLFLILCGDKVCLLYLL